MTRIQAQLFGEQALLPRTDLEKLVEIAQKSDTVDLEYHEVEATTQDIMKMAEQGRSFAFWSEEGEDIYTLEDGSPV